jgi:hypothetical protein
MEMTTAERPVRLVQLLDEVDAAHVLQGDVHDHHVRLQVVNRLPRAVVVLRLAADLQVALLVYELGQAVPEDGVVVHDEDLPPRRHGIASGSGR